VFCHSLLVACGSNAPAANPEADALLAKIAAAKAGDGPLPGTYIGTVNNSEFYVALVIDGNTAVGYLCDGKVDAWLKGTVAGDQVTLTSADGATLTGTLTNNTVTGKVTPAGGSALDFTAPAQQGDESLVRLKVGNDEVDYVGGWIIREDGTRGLLRRILGRGGNSSGSSGSGSSGGGGEGNGTGDIDATCAEAQRQYNEFLVEANSIGTSAQVRSAAVANAQVVLITATGFGCTLTPFG
jgi:hypothetical protein